MSYVSLVGEFLIQITLKPTISGSFPSWSFKFLSLSHPYHQSLHPLQRLFPKILQKRTKLFYLVCEPLPKDQLKFYFQIGIQDSFGRQRIRYLLSIVILVGNIFILA